MFTGSFLDGTVQQWGNSTHPVMNQYAQPTGFVWHQLALHVLTLTRSSGLVFADTVPPPATIALDRLSESVSFVELDLTGDEPLFSDMSAAETTPMYRPSPGVPPEVQAALREHEFVGYAPNILHWRSNQVGCVYSFNAPV
jgi:hypothetical protein